jgi:hypothetical protein
MARVGFPAVLVRRPCLCIVSGVDESLMADEEVASSEGLGADVADERLFFRVRSAGGASIGAGEMHGWRRGVT